MLHCSSVRSRPSRVGKVGEHRPLTPCQKKKREGFAEERRGEPLLIYYLYPPPSTASNNVPVLGNQERKIKKRNTAAVPSVRVRTEVAIDFQCSFVSTATVGKRVLKSRTLMTFSAKLSTRSSEKYPSFFSVSSFFFGIGNLNLSRSSGKNRAPNNYRTHPCAITPRTSR